MHWVSEQVATGFKIKFWAVERKNSTSYKLRIHLCYFQTVIESLRYITTGEGPPLAKSAAFIHDPKVSEWLNQIKI